jgi:4-amino-4-deoxy-L-arabinose transferase-like glycosyltransferase
MSSSTGHRRPAPIDWVAILAIAVVATVALLILAPAYGWHRDELYFVVAGRHPAFGYVDQPPLTPLLSAAAVGLLGPSPTSVRVLPALAFAATVVLAALIARDLGGSRRAQSIAALVVALSGLLAGGHLASTATFDLVLWAVILWLVVRLLAGADPRTWLLVGLAAGIALQNKHIVLVLGAALVAGLLVARRWDVFRTPWAWGAVGLALVMWAPNLAWQAANGLPQLTMAASIADDADDRATVLVELALLAGPLVFPVALAGGWWLARKPAARPWRALVWAAVVGLVLVLVIGGKSYYVAGFLPLLLAAGSIVVDGWLRRGRTRLRAVAFGAATAVSGVMAAVLVLPIVPTASLASTPIPDLYGESAEQIGWPELVATVEAAVADLPAADRARAVIVTGNYGEAGALELLGHDLPPVHSGHNGYWDWGPPPDDRTVVVTVGDASRSVPGLLACRMAGRIDNGAGVDNEERREPVHVCLDMHGTWSTIWPLLRHLD